MSTRCSVIIRGEQSLRGAVSTKSEIGSERIQYQFYHHHDGYIFDGVGEEIVNLVREKSHFVNLKDGSKPSFTFSTDVLERAYEAEGVGMVHWDWAYLYVVEFLDGEINFYVTRDTPTLRDCENDVHKEKFDQCTMTETMTLYAKLTFGEYGFDNLFLNTKLND